MDILLCLYSMATNYFQIRFPENIQCLVMVFKIQFQNLILNKNEFTHKIKHNVIALHIQS